ncbi:hypothetical protein HOD75_01105 [archaeon]|jgi:hypothetical protein|nr:hypothetical protein [archaeon]MBT4241476.1 hypothetical protein [archaeon]MBT4417653.1 hypothetical protein [archaeon]
MTQDNLENRTQEQLQPKISRRSFFVGMGLATLTGFTAGAGAVSYFSNPQENTQPEEYTFEKAYDLMAEEGEEKFNQLTEEEKQKAEEFWNQLSPSRKRILELSTDDNYTPQLNEFKKALGPERLKDVSEEKLEEAWADYNKYTKTTAIEAYSYSDETIKKEYPLDRLEMIAKELNTRTPEPNQAHSSFELTNDAIPWIELGYWTARDALFFSILP